MAYGVPSAKPTPRSHDHSLAAGVERMRARREQTVSLGRDCLLHPEVPPAPQPAPSTTSAQPTVVTREMFERLKADVEQVGAQIAETAKRRAQPVPLAEVKRRERAKLAELERRVEANGELLAEVKAGADALGIVVDEDPEVRRMRLMFPETASERQARAELASIDKSKLPPVPTTCAALGHYAGKTGQRRASEGPGGGMFESQARAVRERCRGGK